MFSDSLVISLKKISHLKIKELLQTSSIYFTATLASKALPFVFLPIFTFYLSTEDFGIISTFKAFGLFLAPLIGLSTNAALSRHFWELKKGSLGEYLSGIFIVIGVTTMIVFLLLFFFVDFLSHIILLPNQGIYLSFFYGLFTILFTIKLTLLQLQKDALKYATLSFILELIQNILAYLLLVIIGAIWQGYLIGFVIATFVMALYALLSLHNKHKLHFLTNNNYVRIISRYGSSYLIGALGIWTINFSDRMFINNLEGLESTGIYSVGYSFGSLVLMLNVAFSRGWLPFFYNNIENNKNKIVKITYSYILLLMLGALGISYLGPFVLKFMVDPKFWGGTLFISWIAFGYAINGACKMFEGYLHYVKKPAIISKIYLIAAGLNLMLNYYFIKAYGPIGAAIATLITFIVILLLLIIYSNKFVKMPWFKFNNRTNSFTR